MSLDDRKAHPFVRTPFDEADGRFSPDGRWVSYQSNQSGRWEIYVQSAGSNGGRLQASEGGGVHAMWQPDGRALTYLSGRDMMRVAFADGAEPDLGRPVRLFSLQPDDLLLDVLKDGRFLVIRRAIVQPAAPLNIVTNWFEHVRRSTQQ